MHPPSASSESDGVARAFSGATATGRAPRSSVGRHVRLQSKGGAMRGWRIVAAVALAVVADRAFGAAAAGTVEGQVFVNGKALKLVHAVAVSGPDTFDGTKQAYL